MKVTLSTTKDCPYSRRARIALAEKKMSTNIVEAGDVEPALIKKIAPTGVFPMLMEKDYSINHRRA
ncbi:glutathione S-transferase N-terminal domain-containing protein, partial [Francisella tularensis subsp. holarctica]